jgi:hypothetical protein
MPYHGRVLRVVAVSDRDQVAGPLDHDGFPPAAFERLSRNHEMAWCDLIPGTRQVLGRRVWICLRQLGGQGPNEQLVVEGAFDERHQSFAVGVQAAYRQHGGKDLPSSFAGYIPAVPMVALAVAELGRVPLASVIYDKHKFMQGIAILGILALGYLAVENWTFGFERIVDLRLKHVNTASRELSRDELELSALVDQRKQVTASSGQKRNELRRGIDQRIAELTAQLSKEAEIHQRNLEGIREACRIIKDKCMVPRSQAEDSRYAAEVSRLSSELAHQRGERKQLLSQIDDLVSRDASDVTALDQKIGIATSAATEARYALRKAADGNQIYRLAASWYGVNTSDVTAEQFATARWVFSTFSAVAVALAGSIAALVYYARSRVPGAPSILDGLRVKLARARRVYYARKSRPLKVQVPGPERVIYQDGKEPPIVVEKEVVRYIDQIFLVPKWGMRFPVHINSLIRRNKRSPDAYPQADDTDDSGSNVTPLRKGN